MEVSVAGSGQLHQSRKRQGAASAAAKFQCGYCKESFRRRFSLRDHIRAAHTGERPYACDMCPKAFVRRHDLTSHVAVHNGTKKFVCSMCGNEFLWRYSYERHLRKTNCSTRKTALSITETGANIVDAPLVPTGTSQRTTTEASLIIPQVDEILAPPERRELDVMPQDINVARVLSSISEPSAPSQPTDKNNSKMTWRMDNDKIAEFIADAFLLKDFLTAQPRPSYWSLEILFRAATQGNQAVVQCFITHAPTIVVHTRDSFNDAALHLAAANGQMSVVRILLDAGVHVDLRGRLGLTAVAQAVISGHLECASRLIEEGADLNIHDNDGRLPLHHVARKGTSDALLLERTTKATLDINHKDIVGQTAMHLAARCNSTFVLKALIQHGGDIYLTDMQELSALDHAFNSRSLECAKILLDKQIADNIKNPVRLAVQDLAFFIRRIEEWPTEYKDRLRCNPESTSRCSSLLHLLVGACDDADGADSLNMMLDAGNYPHAVDRNGETPLHIAARFGLKACLEALIEAGANPGTVDPDRDTPLHSAVFDKSGDSLKFLLQQKLDVNAKNERGETPLWLSVNTANHAALNALIGSQAKIDEPDIDGWTPLHLASELCDAHSVDTLLQAGASVQTRDRFGQTPLHCVAGGPTAYESSAKVRGIVKRLLQEAATDVNALDNAGNSALMTWILTEGVASDAVESLIQTGANVNIINLDGKSALDIALAIFDVWSTLKAERMRSMPLARDWARGLVRVAGIISLLVNHGAKTAQQLSSDGSSGKVLDESWL